MELYCVLLDTNKLKRFSFIIHYNVCLYITWHLLAFKKTPISIIPGEQVLISYSSLRIFFWESIKYSTAYVCAIPLISIECNFRWLSREKQEATWSKLLPKREQI